MAVPILRTEKVFKIFEERLDRQFTGRKMAQVIHINFPAVGNVFRFQTEIIYIFGVAVEPPNIPPDRESEPLGALRRVENSGRRNQGRVQMVKIGLELVCGRHFIPEAGILH